MVKIFILDVVEKSLEYQWIGVDFLYLFRPYKIIGGSSSQGGDSGTVAGRIVSIFIFASSIRSLHVCIKSARGVHQPLSLTKKTI